MAIYVRCSSCRHDNKHTLRICKGCKKPLTNNCKYKVQIKLTNGKYRTKQVDDLRLAKKIESKFKIQNIENKMFNINNSPTLAYAWEQYLSWAKLNKKTWSDDLARWSLHIAPQLANKKMDAITPRNIMDVISVLQNKKTASDTYYKPATVKQVLVLIKRIYNWAIERELYHGSNPASKIPNPRFDNRVNNPLTREGIQRLTTVLDSWDNERASLVVLFALYSGRRRGEVLAGALKWPDIALESGFVTFQGTSTKNGTTQTLPMNNKCKEVLKRCLELKVSEYVFPASTGKYYSGFQNTWRRIRKAAGLSIRFHDLRHTFASYLASSGEVEFILLRNY